MKREWFSAFLAIASAGAAAQAVDPQTAAGNGLEVSAFTIDGGGGRSLRDAFILTGTVAQADAEPQHPATGGSFAVVGGFLPAAGAGQPVVDSLFADGFED